ncbi:putative transferase [Helianthus annuus]|nr:putative transferase [Helianthus annuus]KAJ0637976.1 putative transferase [Helianthus annuus]KAJ0815163.1 putative transferase [Helianthus annuus]
MCFVCPECCDPLSCIHLHQNMRIFPYSRCNLRPSFHKFFQPTCTQQQQQWRIQELLQWRAQKLFSSTTNDDNLRSKPKLLVILGATGAGKSRLSIDLSTRVFKNSEIINSDKMQLYNGLDITTNKMTMQERVGVPHHLLGVLDPTKPACTPSVYRKLGSDIISDIKTRGGLPIVVGGSNSLIYSLVTKRFDPDTDVFNGSDPDPVSLELRYDCCFIWVDVSLPVLNRYLANRVDEMLDSGMFEELVEFFRSGEDKRVNRAGLGQAIGIPEFEGYFRDFNSVRRPSGGDPETEVEVYNEAVKRIKDNTCHLAKKQVGKILRLRDAGWELKRIDATEAFRAVMAADSGGGRVAEVWEKEVLEPSVKIVKRFLDE